MAGIYRLKGAVKHYDWGGTSFIPSLLEINNKENKPFAEYWMGLHPLGVGEVETKEGAFQSLQDIVTDIPFLFKVLDVKDMLSIQVHPSKAAAEKEFARENAEGIALSDPARNYKDDNHKPELMVALSDFWLLHGFKTDIDLHTTFRNTAELAELIPVFKNEGYIGLYKFVMEMPQDEVNRILQPLINRLTPFYKKKILNKTNEDFWAVRASETFSQNGNIDRGIFSIYLFNVVQLKKGEGVFQDAGVPHAYLEGQNVELMATSDNVLRGGLTTKHIDVPELLKHVKCEATIPNILSGEEISSNEKVYKTPVKDFELSVFELREDEEVDIVAGNTEILIATEGVINVGDDDIVLQEGHPSAVILPGTNYRLTGFAGKSILYRASVPA